MNGKTVIVIMHIVTRFCDVATDCKLVIFDESDVYLIIQLWHEFYKLIS